MSEVARVCMNCGMELMGDTNPRRLTEEAPCSEGEDGEHYWSHESALGRLEARVANTEGLEMADCDDNEDWQWAEVKVADGDRVTASEMLSTAMSREGFSFCGLDEEPGVLRVNRPKA